MSPGRFCARETGQVSNPDLLAARECRTPGGEDATGVVPDTPSAETDDGRLKTSSMSDPPRIHRKNHAMVAVTTASPRFKQARMFRPVAGRCGRVQCPASRQPCRTAEAPPEMPFELNRCTHGMSADRAPSSPKAAAASRPACRPPSRQGCRFAPNAPTYAPVVPVVSVMTGCHGALPKSCIPSNSRRPKAPSAPDHARDGPQPSFISEAGRAADDRSP